MKKRLRGSLIVEASIVVPVVIVLSLVMIVLIVKEFQTSVNTMKFEMSMYIGKSTRDVMMEQSQTKEYFRCEDNYNGMVWSEESTVISAMWKQTSDFFKIYDIDMSNMTMIGVANKTIYDGILTSECMRVIRRRRY